MPRKPPRRPSKPRKAADELRADLQRRMADCETAEALNDQVIVPFILALEATCAARGYLLNIYGERSNLSVSTPERAEVIYQLIEDYLDAAER